MKQVYFAHFTQSVTNSAKNGNHGVSPCASSRGIGNEKLTALATDLFPGQTAESAPSNSISLAFVQMNGSGRILRHSKSPPSGKNCKPVNRITHVLMDLPPTLDAQQAIMTWGSRQWQQTLVEGLEKLPDPLFPPLSAELTDDAFLHFISSAENLELFRFVLGAYLTTPETTRIFIAAPDEIVALCIYGLTRVLPAASMEQLTFSTYEAEPLTGTARIIGTLPARESEELPGSCYCGDGVAVNVFTGRKSNLNLNVAYVNFVIQKLAGGSLTHLDEFLNRCRILWIQQQLAQENAHVNVPWQHSGQVSRPDSVLGGYYSRQRVSAS